ncbi:MAG TPA: hypothetical protein VLN56_07235 [Gammaproteobacteria bacterium]|nr:hypothetical protein [Gammaproteobacteria bacterium]
MLTGESVPVDKTVEPQEDSKVLADRRCMTLFQLLFTCTSGMRRLFSTSPLHCNNHDTLIRINFFC